MDRTEQGQSWVVYQMTLHNKPAGVIAVCEQSEWDALESARPGYHLLLRGGIASEGEAERVARARQNETCPATVRLKAR